MFQSMLFVPSQVAACLPPAGGRQGSQTAVSRHGQIRGIRRYAMKHISITLLLILAIASTGCKKGVGTTENSLSPTNTTLGRDTPVVVGADTIIAEGRVGYFSAVYYPGNPVPMPSGYTLSEIKWIANQPPGVSRMVYLDGLIDRSFKNKYVRVLGAIDSVRTAFGYYLEINVFQIRSIV